MEETEYPLLRITSDDVSEANRLSLHCPICASAVEKNLDGAELLPVICAACGTLYHRACWEQSGGKCAILGCGHTSYRVYGRDLGPALRVDYRDIPAAAPNGSAPSPQTRRLKEQQKREVEQLRRPGFWQRLWQWLLDQIQVG